jgi:adenylate cyclase
VALVAGGAGVGLRLGNALRTQEEQTIDTRFSVRGRQPAPRDVVVVAIDARTFDDLGLRWPFPRRLHARVIDRLRTAGARAIGYDVQFTEPTDPADDNALIEAVTRARGIVLATTEVDALGRTKVLGGGEALGASGATPANATQPAGAGGVIRRAPRVVQGLATFGWSLARAARPGLRPPKQDPVWIDFPGPPGTVTSVSYSRVLRGQAPASLFRGRMVVVGPTAPSLQDVHPTSTSGSQVMSGAEIQADIARTFLHSGPLRSTALGIDLLVAALLGALAPICALLLGGLRGRLLPIGGGLAWGVATQLLFDTGWIAPLLAPEAALAIGLVGTLGVEYASAAFERERVFSLFSRFVPESVVSEVVKRAEGARLGGDARVCTVMFTDLRGFTSFSETLPPTQVIDVVNHYLGEMSDAILDAGGTLVAYMGDGIFAVFGAPLDQPDHADRALAAAREMVGERLARFNARLRELGLEADFRMGVGLNTGTVISGNVGSERRLEYAAIGDATNVAARVEGMTKGTPHMLLLTEETRDALTRPPDDLVFVEEQPVRGRRQPIRLWTLREAATVEPAAAVTDAQAPDAAIVAAAVEPAEEELG